VKHQNLLNLDLQIEEDTIELKLHLGSPSNYYFEDEYDLPTLLEVSKVDELLPQDIILKGLFLELQELNVIVDYEDEMAIKRQVTRFCEDFLTEENEQ